jgi:eukaryotic-like serine/threonine-protein kinase
MVAVEFVQGAVVAGRFRLDRKIGEGGMALVWAATHCVTHKQVALKTLKPERAADSHLRHRFIREARAACAVRHPNIVEIDDVLELEDGSPVMVMDLLHGESLGDRLRRDGAMPIAEVARILLPVVSAVGTAHAGGIVHRDLKPDNIFLADDGNGGTVVKVLDFGIAKVLSIESDAAQSGGLTGTGALLGTPYYMAPEQIFGDHDIDWRADAWALGIILYECLSGRRPTEADNIGQILKIVMTDGIVPLQKVAPQTPTDVTLLVQHLLTRDRAARPRSLAEVQQVLRRYTDVDARSFAEPAVARARKSIPAPDEVSKQALIHSSDDAHPLSETRLAATTSRPPAFAASTDRSGVSKLASSTASTTAQRLAIGPRRSRSTLAIAGAGLAIVAAIGASLFGARQGSVAPTLAVPSVSAASVEVAPSLPPAPPASSPAPAPAPPVDGAETSPSPSASATVAAAARLGHGALPAAATHKASTPAQPAPPPSAPPAAAPDCQVPWTIDSAGIKHPRPECMR